MSSTARCFLHPVLLTLLVSGCTGMQSALDPAGSEAEMVGTLFWVMLAGGVVIFIATIGLLIYAVQHEERRRVHSVDVASRLIVYGTAGTVAILGLLLTFAFWLMADLRPWSAEPAGDALQVEVTGEQFWWRVAYLGDNGEPVAFAANEVRLPVGRRVNFVLNSADMIHSFWIPSLGGKMDIIPGRTNQLSLLATKPGTFRAPCAEYCGTSHALMAFSAVSMEEEAFDAWLEARSAPSAAASGEGLDAFLAQGCGACHRIAGTPAVGTVGPDLSHVGSRVTLGAGILPNDVASMARFIREPDVIKPGIRMPSYAMLPPEEIERIARYLKGLE